MRPEALDLSREIVPSGLRREELLHAAARPLITRSSRSKGFGGDLRSTLFPSTIGGVQ